MKRKYFSKNSMKKLNRIRHCQRCGGKHPDLEKHHIKPIRKGGTNNIKNIRMLCPKCHKIEDKEN